MRSKPVRFWSVEPGYAELMFEGGMKTAKAWQPTVSSLHCGVFWQSSNRAHFDANQSNEIKACTFLKCCGRICRIDLWRWNEDSQRLATYCELATCGDSDNLPIARILTQTNPMRSKPVRFWSVEPGYAELMFEGGMKTAKAWQPTVSSLPVGILTIFQSRAFWRKLIQWDQSLYVSESVEPGYAELMFEGGMKTAKAWQPTVSSLPVGILTIFQSGSFWRKPIKWDQSLYVSEVLSQDMQNWCLKVEWRQPKPGNLLWAGYTSSLPNGLIWTQTNLMWSKPVLSEVLSQDMQNWCLKVEWRQPRAWQPTVSWRCGLILNLPIAHILTQTNQMRSKPVRFWSVEPGYAELMFEGGMKTAKAWQPTVSSLPVGILTIFQSRSFWRKPIKWDQSLYVSEVLRQDMQNWCLKVKWRQPKPGNLLWARYLWGFWQSSNRAHFDANQSNEIKACTFLKCWARICRIDVWRWNEDSQSLATYCELATCGDSDNLPIALILTQINLMRSKPVRFWSVEPGYAELMFEGGMKTAKAWQPTVSWIHSQSSTQTNPMDQSMYFLECWARICRKWNEDSQSLATYCELDTRRVMDNLPNGLILTQTNLMRSKPVRFWSSWARICRIDVWRWNEDSQSLATYCELETRRLINWISNRAHFDANQSNEIKACTFLKCWARICRIDVWRWNEDSQSLATYCELNTRRVMDNLPNGLILTQTNLMRSKPVRFWSIEAGYAELIFEGEMKTANAWQPTVSSLPVGILTIFQSRAFWRKLIQWDQSLYVSEVLSQDMQNWCLKVEWRQPKPGNLLWARYLWGFWQSSNRAHFDANQSNEIKACTFLKCWARICRIDVWRWNEDSQSLATYCELKTRRLINNLPIALILTQTNQMRSKPVRFWSVEPGYAELMFEGGMKIAKAWQPTVSLATLWIDSDNLPIALILTQTNQMRSKPVRFWSVEPGYAELMFEGGMKTAKAWQPTVSSLHCGVFWQSSNRAHFDANQSNEIKACTFLKCWARICRIDVWRWNEDSQSLANYCELATLWIDSDNLPIARILTQTNPMRSKPVRFWSVEPGYAELMFEGGMKTAKAWQPTVSWIHVE